MTAGIETDQIELLKNLVNDGSISVPALSDKLQIDYGKETIYDLGKDEADLLISEIRGY